MRISICRRSTAAVVALFLICGAGAATAAGRKGAWYVTAGVGYHTTQDFVGSNADLATDLSGQPSDPRPDDFGDRETTIEDTFCYRVAVGFGLTDHLALQVNTGYFKGDVGPVDAFLVDQFPFALTPLDPTLLAFNSYKQREESLPFVAGTLREIPVTLSLQYSFRKDQPWRPYIGAGYGMVFTQFDGSDELGQLNDRLAHLRIRAVLDENRNEVTPDKYKSLKGRGMVPLTNPLSVDVGNATTWHLNAGLEYRVSQRISIIGDASFQSTNQSVNLELRNQDEVQFLTFSENLFRKDGSLKYFHEQGRFPNPPIDPNDPHQGLAELAQLSPRIGFF